MVAALLAAIWVARSLREHLSEAWTRSEESSRWVAFQPKRKVYCQFACSKKDGQRGYAFHLDASVDVEHWTRVETIKDLASKLQQFISASDIVVSLSKDRFEAETIGCIRVSSLAWVVSPLSPNELTELMDYLRASGCSDSILLD